MNVIWVSPDGNDATATGSREEPYQTIEAALLAFSSGDQIRLEPGTYTPATTVSFVGVDGSLFSDVPGGATICPVAAPGSAGVSVETSARFSIYGVRVKQSTNATSAQRNCYGIYCKDVSQLLIQECVVEDFALCNNDMYGIYTENCTGKIIRCHVEDIVDMSYASLIYGICTTGGRSGTSWMDIIDCGVRNLAGAGAVVRGIYNMTSLSLGGGGGMGPPPPS